MTDPKNFDVVLFPDPVLRKETEEITAFDDELKGVVEGMFERMFESQGVGLAAPQVGLDDCSANDEGDRDKPERNLALINPTISFGGQKTRHEEGCLSPPACTRTSRDGEASSITSTWRATRSRRSTTASSRASSSTVRPPAGRPARRSNDAQRQAPQPRRGGRVEGRVPSAHREPVLTGRACCTAP